MTELADRLHALALRVKARFTDLERRAIPLGGASGQVLAKNSNADFDTGWGNAAGAASYAVTSTAANYTETVTSGEKIIDCTAAITVTLPSAIGNAAKIHVKNLSGGTVTVNAVAAQTIDGGTTASLPPQATISLISDGANWVVV